MSVGARVYSRDNDHREYELKALLGSGAIGGVYRGSSRDGSEIAVKIPHARLPADLEQRFWQELAVLNKLGERSGGRYFPRAWRGILADSGREVLCMTLVGGDRLVKIAEKNAAMLEEGLALKAGLQYARMLEILHGAEISCPDRKADDLYWDSATEQLTVLDWNVVKQGQSNMDPAQDLYIFGSLWYQFMTGSLPSPVDERLRQPLEEHPNWPKISYGLQTILRKALSPDLQWRYQSSQELREALQQHQFDYTRRADDLLRDAEAQLRKAKEPYSEGIAALYKAEGARFYNEQEADENVQIAIGHIRTLQQSRDQALRLADLAKRRQVVGAETVWREAQDLRKGLIELVENGSRRVRMVQYTAALQWLKVAKEAVAEDRLEMLKLRRWQALADAGQAAIVRDLSLKQNLDAVAEAVEQLERGQTSSAANLWARLAPRLEAAGWRESDEAGRHLWSLGHETVVWQEWEKAKQAEDTGQYEQAAGRLELAIREAENVVYADRLLAVLGHTARTIAEAAKGLHGRARVEESANNLLKKSLESLEKGDFTGAVAHSQTGLALLAGKPVIQDLYKRLERNLRLARLLPKLDGILQALPEPRSFTDGRLRDWSLALDVIEKLAGEGDLEPFVRPRVSAAIEGICDELNRFRRSGPKTPVTGAGTQSEPQGGRLLQPGERESTNASWRQRDSVADSWSRPGSRGFQQPERGADWRGVTSGPRALEITNLINRLSEFYTNHGPWLDKVMQWPTW